MNQTLKNKIIEILKKNTWNGRGEPKYFKFEDLTDQILMEVKKETKWVVEKAFEAGEEAIREFGLDEKEAMDYLKKKKKQVIKKL